MKVICFASYYHPHVGGYCKNIHELSKRLVQKGYKVTVVTCDTESVRELEYMDGICIVRLPCWNLMGGNFPIPKLSKHFFGLFGRYSGKPADVVVTQTRFFATSLLGLLFAKRHRLSLIHVERGTVHSVLPSKVISWLARVYDHTFGSLIVKSARVNVGISESACEFIRHLGGKNVKLVYNGIDEYVSSYARVSHNGEIRVTYVGRLIYAKGVQDLIQAFDWCSRGDGRWKLWIVGDGNYMEELKSLAKVARCGDNIKFCGELGHDAVMNVLSLSDIFVNPSYSEGLPTSVMEAASVGLPIMATDVGGTREIISHMESGILVAPHNLFQLADSLKLLALDTEEAKRMGRKARSVVIQKFNWDNITEQWDNLLKEIVGDEN